MDNIIRVVVVLIILGILAWVVLALVPLPWPFGQIILVFLVIAGIIYAYKGLGGRSF